MISNPDYSNLSTADLLAKQKSTATWQKIFVGSAAVLVLMTLYSIYKKTHNMHPFLILGSLVLILNNNSKLKKIQDELNKRNA